MKQLFIVFNIRFFSQMQIIETNQTIVMIVYISNFFFNHYKNFYVFVHKQIFQSKYKFSSKRIIVNEYLKKAYENVKTKINVQLNICFYFNFFIDETINIRKKQMINLCFHVFFTAIISEKNFHIKTKIEIARTITVRIQIQWMTQKCKKITDNQFWKMNCIKIDTCFIIRTMWKNFFNISKMFHVFIFSCDNYSLQLLMNDILKKKILTS